MKWSEFKQAVDEWLVEQKRYPNLLDESIVVGRINVKRQPPIESLELELTIGYNNTMILNVRSK